MNLVFHETLLKSGDFQLRLDVELTRGVTGLFGHSGAGKTTILEAIAGLRRLDRGCITLGDQTLSDASRKIFVPSHLRKIGYVPQDLALFPHLTVRGNLVYGRPKTEPIEHVCDILEIKPLLDRWPASLSGGEKQRVAFARALHASPRLLLLDEPLASLDQPLKSRILPYLQRIRGELAIPMIYVTHAAEEIVELCDEVLILSKGECLQKGAPVEVFTCTQAAVYRYERDLA